MHDIVGFKQRDRLNKKELHNDNFYRPVGCAQCTNGTEKFSDSGMYLN